MKNQRVYFITTSIAMAAIFILQACVGSRYSNLRKGEKVSLRIHEDANYLALNKLRYQPVPEFEARGTENRGVGVGQVISLAILGVNKLIELDKSAFTATYGQSLNELFFYDQISKKGHLDPTGMQFKGFDIVRTIKIDKQDTTAFFASIELDNSNPYEVLNSSVFRLRIKDFKLRYSRAKASDTRWYAPWSWGNANQDDKMNMDIDIKFITSYATSDGAMHHNVEIGHFTLNLRDMPLNPKDKNYETYYKNLINQRLGGYSFLVPRSYGHALSETGELEEAYSQGNYRIEINVKETGKEKYIKKILAENSTSIIKEGSGQIIKLMNKK